MSARIQSPTRLGFRRPHLEQADVQGLLQLHRAERLARQGVQRRTGQPASGVAPPELAGGLARQLHRRAPDLPIGHRQPPQDGLRLLPGRPAPPIAIARLGGRQGWTAAHPQRSDGGELAPAGLWRHDQAARPLVLHPAGIGVQRRLAGGEGGADPLAHEGHGGGGQALGLPLPRRIALRRVQGRLRSLGDGIEDRGHGGTVQAETPNASQSASGSVSPSRPLQHPP